VAKCLQVAEHTVYRLAGARQIPARKVGGTRRFCRADIEESIKR
jgi:excisionase family DNA binding protein